MKQTKIIERMLSIMEKDIFPLTAASTETGNKIFGAAILLKKDLSLVIAATNEETANPLFHGEISCLNKFWALPDEQRPDPKECLFFSTHEPCSLCLSGITWSGFDNFYYLFSYEDSRDSFNIPHDLKILDEVFKCEEGEYNPVNYYWKSYYLLDLINMESPENRELFLSKVETLKKMYDNVSDKYQQQKGDQHIPLD